MCETVVEEFDGVVAQLPELLSVLTNAPACRMSEKPVIPKVPGVYLFTDDGKPIYVGRSKKLGGRLAQHTKAPRDANQTSFAFNIAKREAAADGIDIKRTRATLVADPDFMEHFQVAAATVAEMDVQFVEIDDLIVRAVFEVYASLALGTAEFNQFGEH